jgi:hypothetical protein
MDALKDNYGKKKGEAKYLEMRSARVKGYVKGLHTAKRHGHTALYVPKYTK